MHRITLPDDDQALLAKITADLPILADLCRSDVQLFCPDAHESPVLVSHAAPHSVAPIYTRGESELWQGVRGKAMVQTALLHKVNPQVVHTLQIRGGLIARQIYPVHNAKGSLIAVLTKDSYWLAHERHKRRAKVFQDALHDFILMVLRGELEGAEQLESFGEHDGIVYIGSDRQVLYVSGVAAGLYRHFGYRDSLVGRRINELSVFDQQLFNMTSNQMACLQQLDEHDGLTWIRKGVPIIASPPTGFARLLAPRKDRAARFKGVLLLVHDATESVETQREIESKMSLIREVHHRVKNNLQVIASLMRMQARRVSTSEAREVLEESLNRVLSVAVVHEFLSQNATGSINLQEVANRIVAQMHQGLIDPSKQIEMRVSGDSIWLPAERATQCALVINELVQNALEHGLENRDQGSVDVILQDLGDKVKIAVSDSGGGLPEGFELDSSSSLGLRIVRSLVERDLRGSFTLESSDGTQAVVVFTKTVMGG